MKNLFFLLPLIILSVASHAEEKNVAETPFEYTKRIHDELNAIKTLDPKVYFSKIDVYRSHLEKYIEHKKRVCDGEFSTIILSGKEEGDKSKPSRKLSKEERQLCFRELKALQITYINNMYVARKGYLDHLHQKRIQELQDSKDSAIKSLNSSFDKRRR